MLPAKTELEKLGVLGRRRGLRRGGTGFCTGPSMAGASWATGSWRLRWCGEAREDKGGAWRCKIGTPLLELLGRVLVHGSERRLGLGCRPVEPEDWASTENKESGREDWIGRRSRGEAREWRLREWMGHAPKN